MVTAIRSTARLLTVVAIAGLILLMGGTFANAQQDPALYPPPEQVPVTDVITDVQERPVTAVRADELAVTGFDLRAALALGALLVLVGGGVLAADRWYQRRLQAAITA
jgi:hypothetical protein